MPRTKKIQSRSKSNRLDTINYLEYIEKECSFDLEHLRASRAEFQDKIDCICDEQELYLTNRFHKTVAEYLNNSTISSTTINSTISLSNAKKRNKRSVSAGDDEGYRTNDSSSGSGGVHRTSRRSRTVQRSASKPRVSRSLSRLNVHKKNSTNIKTPANRQPPKNIGTITPKVNLCTPQTILRRPKTGEVAVSLQGSPLLTNGCVLPEEKPNINIPLPDGRLLSLQPLKGLRLSQLPHFDEATIEQLQTLRDNLEKVFAKK